MQDDARLLVVSLGLQVAVPILVLSPVAVDLGEAVHELEEDEFLEDFVVLVEAAIQGAFDGGVGEDDAMPQLAHPERVQEVPQVGEHLVLGVVLGAYKRQLRAEVPVDLGNQGGVTEAEFELHGLAFRQGVVADHDVAVLVEAADAQVVGLLAHQERVVEGWLGVHESLEHVAEAFGRQRGLAPADFELGRRPDLFLRGHGLGVVGDFLDHADDDTAGSFVLGEMDAEGEAGLGVEDVVTVRHEDELLLEEDRLRVLVLAQGAADTLAVRLELFVAFLHLTTDVREEEQLVYEEVMGVPAGAFHAGLDRSAGHLDEVREGLVAEFSEELGKAARMARRKVLVLTGEPGLRTERDLVTDQTEEVVGRLGVLFGEVEADVVDVVLGDDGEHEVGVGLVRADDADREAVLRGDEGVFELLIEGEDVLQLGAEFGGGQGGGVVLDAGVRDGMETIGCVDHKCV